MVIRIIAILLLALLMSPPSFAGDKKVVFASLFWPPYSGEALPREGASSAVLRDAFEAMGYEVEIRFYPWNRTMHEFKKNPEIHGYFPEYTGRESEFLYSDSIGKSPIGFAERVGANYSWHSYEDLKGYLIGTVQGYVNTKKFDEMVETKQIVTDSTVSDILNLRKLVAKRVDLAVVDMNVFTYLLNSDSLLHENQHTLRIDPRLLGINDLYACFLPTEEGRKLQRVLNEGLKKINAREVQRVHLKRTIEKLKSTKSGNELH